MSLSAKLLEVQTEAGGKLGFDASNPHFKAKYVTLNKVLETVTPLLQARGVLLTQFLTHGQYNDEPALETKFTDTETGGEWGMTTPLVLEKQTPQGLGSAITYFRRYSILSALGLVGDDDDDAEAATVAAAVVPSKTTVHFS